MFKAISFNLARLFDPNGRESRSMFWWYVLFVAIVRFLAGLAVSLPMTIGMVGSAMSSGGRLDPQQLQAQMMDKVIAALPQMVWASVAIGVVSCLLLTTALVRRLHDIGLSGWLVLVAGAPYLAALARMPASIDIAIHQIRQINLNGTPPNPMAMVGAQGFWPFLSWIAVIFVVVVGCIKSNQGPNKYGDMPEYAE